MSKKSKVYDPIQNELNNLGGKVFIGFVHPTIYGHMRNLNCIVEGVSAKELGNYLLNGWEKLGIEIWQETTLATKPGILPWENTYTTERAPKVVKSIKEFEDHIRNTLEKNKSLNGYDWWYYRKGIM